HAERGRFTATHARSGAANIKKRAFGEHHVRESLLVDVLLRRFRHTAIEVERGFVPRHILIVFRDHLERVVIATCIDAFGAAFAFGWINKNAELAAAARVFLFDHVVILVRDSPLLAHALAQLLIFDFRQSLFESCGFCDFAQDSCIRTLGDAIHAADAVFGDEFGNIGSDVTEIPKYAGARWNYAAGDLVVRL